ncbi:MAG: M1 family aminopeptidase, partial [Nevskiales bacterium]
MPSPQTKYLQDYRPPIYWVDAVELHVAIHDDHTEIRSRLQLRKNSAAETGADLVLDGRQLELRELKLNGVTLAPEAYRLTEEHLIIPAAPADLVLEGVTRIQPERNTSLEGFYRSGPVLCTQCEAHGFSRITYFPDRPDVLARFTATLEADSARYPLLLANGNEVGRGGLPDGRHWVRWEDPFPKPCYLFAMVAGKLACVQDQFRTASAREVSLRIYVEPGEERRAAFALASLKQAMRWDEEAYGLEYDLDLYMIVAVRDFNMGAMENKGLNLFNSRYILADARTATDNDYEHVQSVIGHEYFHNWTGNRVTCR